MVSSALAALTSTTGNKTDCWNTPPDFVGDVIKFFGTIDLDPCSNDENNPNVPATKVYTEETNGLAHKWISQRSKAPHSHAKSSRGTKSFGNQMKNWPTTKICGTRLTGHGWQSPNQWHLPKKASNLGTLSHQKW